MNSLPRGMSCARSSGSSPCLHSFAHFASLARGPLFLTTNDTDHHGLVASPSACIGVNLWLALLGEYRIASRHVRRGRHAIRPLLLPRCALLVALRGRPPAVFWRRGGGLHPFGLSSAGDSARPRRDQKTGRDYPQPVSGQSRSGRPQRSEARMLPPMRTAYRGLPPAPRPRQTASGG